MTDAQITVAMRDLALRQVDLAAHCVEMMRIPTENRRDILDAVALVRGRVRAEGGPDLTAADAPAINTGQRAIMDWLRRDAWRAPPLDWENALNDLGALGLVEYFGKPGAFFWRLTPWGQRVRAQQGTLHERASTVVLNADDRGNPA